MATVLFMVYAQYVVCGDNALRDHAHQLEVLCCPAIETCVLIGSSPGAKSLGRLGTRLGILGSQGSNSARALGIDTAMRSRNRILSFTWQHTDHALSGASSFVCI